MKRRRPALGLLALCLPYAPLWSEEAHNNVDAIVPSHPSEVALVEEGEKGSVYRQFPSGLRLYTSERDPPGASVCYGGCASAWPPLLAPVGSHDIGDWEVLERNDGTLQWMLNGKPVYTRFHDSPDTPTGDGIDAVWNLVPYIEDPDDPAQTELQR